MKIESINVAKPVTFMFNDEMVETGLYKTPVKDTVEIHTLGVAGDTIVDQSVHGGIDQAVYMYHSEDYQWWSEQLGKEVVAGSFGENLTLSGLADIDFNVGDRLTINNVVLEITAPRVPCFKLSSKMGDSTFLKKFVRAERPGAYARVIQEGSISAGDTITFEKVSSAEVSLKDIFVMWHSKDKSPEFMQQVLASSVASVHREKIQTWLDAV